MRFLWVLPVLGLMGCGGSNQAANTPKQESRTIAAPRLTEGELGLIHNRRILRVKDRAEDVSRAFPSPTVAYTFKDLPPGFASPFRAEGYETARDGFGVIYYQGELSAAIHREQGVTVEDVAETRKRYENEFGPGDHHLTGGSVYYIFWERGDQRLMLCSARDLADGSRYNLTLAIGAKTVLDALRINLEDARRDKAEAEKLYSGTGAPG
ncbi:MAG TPA: hypothetical protein VEX38_02790 [Fimbriimonadaceae bacterium]|nr:hypothetical protein [Fimbriimonadaceae bacterium]